MISADMYAGEFYDYEPAQLFHDVGLCSSKNEARRLIKQGGLRVHDKVLTSNEPVGYEFLFGLAPKGYQITSLHLWRGKKKGCVVNLDWSDHVRVVVK